MKRIVLGVLLAVLSGCCLESSTTAHDTSPTAATNPDLWKTMFSPVDVQRADLNLCLQYIDPISPDMLQRFNGQHLNKGLVFGTDEIVNTSAFWFSVFFKSELVEVLKKNPPSKYHLSQGNESSCLYYQWKERDGDVEMFESGNGILLRVHRPARLLKNLKSEDLSKLIFDRIKTPQTSASDIGKAFKLPPLLHPGDIFANLDKINVVLIGGWEDEIVGFVSEDCINVICFKANGGRAAIGFGRYRRWLNDGMSKD
jgi:hypothetical protein